MLFEIPLHHRDYLSLFCNLLAKKLENIESLPVDELLDFLTHIGIFKVVRSRDSLFCRILSQLSTKLQMNDEHTQKRIGAFITSSLKEYPRGNPFAAQSSDWDALFAKLIEEVNEPKFGRSGSFIVTGTICTALTRVKAPPRLIEYLLNQSEISDSEITGHSLTALATILVRMKLSGKHAIHLKSPGTLPQLPILFPPQTMIPVTEEVEQTSNDSEEEGIKYELPETIFF